MQKAWWKEAVIYQIYPRSFCDSNGDGIGDIGGIISKLDYLKDLGVDVLWLCPVYKSPNRDNGYDIADYYDIMDDFGTLSDFEELLEKVHSKGMKLIMDLVVNHTSDENEWFKQSRSSCDNPMRNYYIWRKGNGNQPPNDWKSFFSGSVWKFDEKTSEYYLHLFAEGQPDLNWENKEVRNSVYKMMRWWFEKGIDGFRMDVISCISKVDGLPSVDSTVKGLKWGGKFFIDGPHVHEYLREMNEEVLSKYDCMTVGETPNVSTKEAALYTSEERNELNMIFQSDLMDVDSGKNGKFDFVPVLPQNIYNTLTKWQLALQNNGWNSLFLGNHDNPRAVSRFGDDKNYRELSAKALAAMILTLKGTPYIYQGEELGMTNYNFKTISDVNDIESINYYNEAKNSGVSTEKIMNAIRKKGRDNARTPMQWSREKYAGFSSVEPWLAVNENYSQINAESEHLDENSVLNFYKKLLKVRKENETLIYGSFRRLFSKSENVFAYLRELDNKKILVGINLSSESVQSFSTEISKFKVESLLASNYPREEKSGKTVNSSLRPYEAVIISLAE